MKKVIGMCDGVFDLMHFGHIKLLNSCREDCDLLIVAVADDKFARCKGANRPYISQENRLFSIKSLSCVDLAFLCDGGVDIVNQIMPDIYFKGGEYKTDPKLDKRIIIRRMEIHPVRTTQLVEMIRGKIVRGEGEE